MTTSSPGSHRASRVAAMASVAPTVTSTSVSGSRSRPYQARWCAATARRSSGMPALGRVLVAPLPDGRHRDLAQLVGSVGVGEALAEVDRAGGGGQLGHGGEDRGGERLQAPGQIRVPRCHRDDRTCGGPVAPIVGADRAQHRQLQHALRDGRVGQALRLRPRHRLPGRRRDRARGGVDRRGGRPEAGSPPRRPTRSATRSSPTRSGEGRRIRPQAGGHRPLDRPGRCGPIATGRSTWTACARCPRACGRCRAGRRRSRGPGASPCWCGRTSRSSRRGSCP